MKIDIAVDLKSGGTVTFTVEWEPIDLTQTDAEFIFDFVKSLSGYLGEAMSVTPAQAEAKNPCRAAAEDWCTRPTGHDGKHRGNSGFCWLQVGEPIR